MSLQAQPQQPVQIYPTSVTNQPSPHHSNGSFGTVFIVLAIILVISTIACVLGRFCNRRYSNQSHNQRPIIKPHRQQIHNIHSREGDIEFGIDKRIPTFSRPNNGPNGVHGHGGIGGTHHPIREGDIEFGIDKRFPTTSSRPNGNGHGHGHGHGAGIGSHPPSNGNMKGYEMKHGHEGEFRADA